MDRNSTAEDKREWALALLNRDRVKCAIVGCERVGQLLNWCTEHVAFPFSTHRVEFFLCDKHMEERGG